MILDLPAHLVLPRLPVAMVELVIQLVEVRAALLMALPQEVLAPLVLLKQAAAALPSMAVVGVTLPSAWQFEEADGPPSASVHVVHLAVPLVQA